MAELIKFEFRNLPKIYVVGKEIKVKVSEVMMNNPIPKFWKSCMEDCFFNDIDFNKETVYENSLVGFMSEINGDGFSYICGVPLTHNEFTAPDDYTIKETEPMNVAVGYVKGKDVADVYMQAHQFTIEEIKARGYKTDMNSWCMELYNNPRFTQPDQEGNIIMDYYLPCFPES